MTKYLPFFLLLLLPIAALADAQTRTTLRFSCSVEPSASSYQAFEELYRTAFDALGYDFEMAHQPSKRSLLASSRGTFDGECARYDALLSEGGAPPGLIKVESPLLRLEYVLWAKDPKLAAKTPEQLLQSNLRIGYEHGTVSLQYALAGIASPVLFNDTEQGMRMLAGGRLDLVCALSTRSERALAALNLSPAPIKVGVLRTVVFYPYLNRKHQALAAPLAALLNHQLSQPQHPLSAFYRETQ